MGEESENRQQTGKEANFKGAVGNRIDITGNQPTGEQKRRGWDKKRRGKELVNLILSSPFKGGEGELRTKIAEYFGISEDEISIEDMILYKQVEKAIKTGDTRAAEFIFDRLYGKPLQSSNVQISDEPIKITLNLGNEDNLPSTVSK